MQVLDRLRVAAFGLTGRHTQPDPFGYRDLGLEIGANGIVAQETPFHISDEPVAFLDPAVQLETMQLFSCPAQNGHRVMVFLDDIGPALCHAARLIVLQQVQINKTDMYPLFQPLEALA